MRTQFGISGHAARTPDKPALVCRGQVRTYGELDDRTSRLAHVLRSLGAGEGDVVAAMLPNGFEFVEVGGATAKTRSRFLPVNWHLKADELAYILQDSGAKVLVADVALGSAVRTALARAPSCQLVTVGGDYEQLLAGADATLIEGEVTWSPMFYTSGTTGRPKGVEHSYDGAAMTMAQQGQVALWEWTADDVYLMAGPAYHGGPGGWMMTSLFVGATTVILPKWDARECLRLIEAHRVTRSFMVPAHFIRLLEVPEEERAGFDTSTWRLVVHAAAPCPVDVKRRMMAAFPHVAVWELYGASEGGATKIGPDEWQRKPGSVGRPWPGVEVLVLDDELQPVPVGEEGVVYIRPAMGQRFRYRADDEKTRQAWHDGAFTVGDVGRLDEDGYLYITDRKSDMVIRGGVNVYPREVEEVLHRHPRVIDCAVFGVPDDRYGEALKAVVEATDADAAELAAWCRDHLADFKVPTIFELVPTLPRDPNGKVLKRQLREQHWRGRASRL